MSLSRQKFLLPWDLSAYSEGGAWRQARKQSWKTQRKGKSRVLSQQRVRTGRRSELNTLEIKVRGDAKDVGKKPKPETEAWGAEGQKPRAHQGSVVMRLSRWSGA